MADHPRLELPKVVLPQVLGVILGLGSALIVANYQADSQRKQLIFDRKITAIKEFSSVSSRGPAERAARIVALRGRTNAFLRAGTIASQQTEAIVNEYVSIISSFSQWGAEQASQATITAALTGSKAPRYPNAHLSFPRWEQIRTENTREQRQDIEKLQVSLGILLDDDIQFNKAIDAYVSTVAGSLLDQ